MALALAAAMAYYTLTIPDPMGMRAREHAPVVRILARDGALRASAAGGGVCADRPPAAAPHRCGDRH